VPYHKEIPGAREKLNDSSIGVTGWPFGKVLYSAHLKPLCDASWPFGVALMPYLALTSVQRVSF